MGLQRRPLDMVTGRDLEDGQLEGQLAEDLDQELGKGCVGNGVENLPCLYKLWCALPASLDRLGSIPTSNSEGEVSEPDRLPTLSNHPRLSSSELETCPNSLFSASSPFSLSSLSPGAFIILQNQLHQRHRLRRSRFISTAPILPALSLARALSIDKFRRQYEFFPRSRSRFRVRNGLCEGSWTLFRKRVRIPFTYLQVVDSDLYLFVGSDVSTLRPL